MSKFNGSPGYVLGRGRQKPSYAVPSGGVLDLRAFDGRIVHVGGTGTVTTILPPPNGECIVVFDAACTLTYNAATLIVPGAVNLTTAANDTMIVADEDGTAARVIHYMKANGQAITSGINLVTPPITPAAAATVDALTAFSSTYDNYLIMVDGVKPSAADVLLLRLATGGAADAGSNYISQTLDAGGSGAPTSSTTSTSIILSNTVLNTGIGAVFKIEIMNANDATNAKIVISNGSSQVSAAPTTVGSQAKTTVYTPANTVSGFRLFWNAASNFAATGKVRIYGYQNS